MINTAIVSSTIFPPIQPLSDGSPRAVHSPTQRLLQTVETINSLRLAGISDIYLIDNSGLDWREEVEQQLIGAKIIRMAQGYFYDNKGINELQMLLSCIDCLPPTGPILKISGRYKLLNLPDLPHESTWDMAGRLYVPPNMRNISTRMYVVRNRDIFRRLLSLTLREAFAYQGRLVGPKAAIRILKNMLGLPSCYKYEDPHIPIEMALANVVLAHGFKIERLERLNIEGEFGSFSLGSSIRE